MSEEKRGAEARTMELAPILTEGIEPLQAGDEAAVTDRFDRIAALAREMLAAPASLVGLAEGRRIVVRSAMGLPGLWQRGARSPLAEGFCRIVVEDSAPVAIEDAGTAVDPAAAALRESGLLAGLAMPIRLRDRTIGALAVLDRVPRLWSATDRRRLTDFAAVIDGEIELQSLAGERDAARQEAEILAQEQSHRVKNSLAVASSLVALSGTDAKTAAEVVRVARDRISALSAAHNVLKSGEGTGDLRTLLDMVLSPYARSGGLGVRLKGEPVSLPERKVTPLSLIFHELATNACKYGGLSSAGGGLDLDWSTGEQTLSIAWRETLPAQHIEDACAEETESGFGSRLVELSVRQMAGEMQIGQAADGGRKVTLILPWP